MFIDIKMSAQPLNYFEHKESDEIINWMIANLTDTQIRSCIDGKGVPSSAPEPSAPVAPIVPDAPIVPVSSKAAGKQPIGPGAQQSPVKLDGDLDEDFARDVEIRIARENEESADALRRVEEFKNTGGGSSSAAGEADVAQPSPSAAPVVPVADLFLKLPTVPESVDISDAPKNPQLEQFMTFQLKMGDEETWNAKLPIMKKYFRLPPLFIYDVSGELNGMTPHYYELSASSVGAINLVENKNKRPLSGAHLIRLKWASTSNKLEEAIKTWPQTQQDKLPKLVDNALEQLRGTNIAHYNAIRSNYKPLELKRISSEAARRANEDLSYFGKLVNQSDSFLQRYGTNKFGSEFMTKYRPNKTKNKFGVETLQWVKR